MRAALRGPGRIVGLAVGESTLPLYASLPSDGWDDRVIVPVDELVPAPEDRQMTFAARLRASLPRALRDRVRELPGDPDASVARDGLCALVLGLGPDGHVAFNQPGSASDSVSREVTIAPRNLARLRGVAPAERALTMGVATILRAAAIALVVAGPGKDGALARVLEGPEGADVPASFLRRHASVAVFRLDG